MDGHIRRRKGEQPKVAVTETNDNQQLKEDQLYRTGFGTLLKIALVMFVLLPALCVMCIGLFVKAPIEAESFSLGKPPAFEGPLTPNTRLRKAVRKFENELRGPESMIMRNGLIYTGTADGKIVEINKDKIRTVAKLGTPPCGSFEDEPTCGRPLGMRFNHEGRLIVLDAYLGIFEVTVETGNFKMLLPSTVEIDGERPALLNDLDIDSDGMIYFTDSSTKWQRRFNRYAILEASANGRLVKYDPVKNNTQVLMRKLSFANGVQLSRNQEYLLVVETTFCRIHKYYLKGPKAGQSELFTDNMPGLPDNVRPSSSGGYWVGIAVVRNPNKFGVFDGLSTWPGVRNLFTKIFPMEWFMKFLPKYGLIVEYSTTGQIIQSLHDPEGRVLPSVSEVEDHSDVLYLGSYFAPYLGVLDLNDAPPE